MWENSAWIKISKKRYWMEKKKDIGCSPRIPSCLIFEANHDVRHKGMMLGQYALPTRQVLFSWVCGTMLAIIFLLVIFGD